MNFPSSLATIFLVIIALKNSNIQAAPQFHLVDFSTPLFSYFTEKPEILSRDSHESLRNVTLQQIMSLESQASEVRWDRSCARCESCHWLSVVWIVYDICFVPLPLPSVTKVLTPPEQSSTSNTILHRRLSIGFLGHVRAHKALRLH